MLGGSLTLAVDRLYMCIKEKLDDEGRVMHLAVFSSSVAKKGTLYDNVQILSRLTRGKERLYIAGEC